MNSFQLLQKNLRALRNRHGLTQEEFAAHAGFSQKFYQQIESGNKKQIWLETVERLAKAYDVETWELLTTSPPRKAKITGKIRKSKIHQKSNS